MPLEELAAAANSGHPQRLHYFFFVFFFATSSPHLALRNRNPGEMQAAATITKSGVKHFRKAPRNISWVIWAAYFGFGKPRLRKNVFPYRQVTPRGGVRRAPVTLETSGGPE